MAGPSGPSSALVSVCLFRPGGPRPVSLSVSVLRGLQSAHPPLPGGTVTARDVPSGRGELCQSCVVCVMCSRFLCPSCAGMFLEASWRHSSSGFSLSQFVLFLHVIPDRQMMIRSDDLR